MATVNKCQGILCDGQSAAGMGDPAAALFGVKDKAVVQGAEGKGYGEIGVNVPAAEKMQKLHVDTVSFRIFKGVIVDIRDQKVCGQFQIDQAV